jgi:transcriptional regulator with XRE-family HTH domain
LRVLRNASRLSREDLGLRSGVSSGSVKAYELGRRNPSRESLTALLDTLQVDRHDRNEILEQAGFAPDSVASGRERDDPQQTLTEAVAEISSQAWPAFIANEQMSVVEANATAQALWGVNMALEFTSPIERNLLAVMTTPRIADRIANWDEAAGILASMVRSFEAATASDSSMPY